jgi:MFS transporter, SP family, sugar:H+ symporter
MFFKQAGLQNPFLISMIMGTVNCLFTLPGLYMMDRVGRRTLLLWGAVIQSLSQFLVGIIYEATHGQQPIFTAIFSGVFIAGFASTWGPCAWVITSELFGLKTRAKQMSLAAAGNWYAHFSLGC